MKILIIEQITNSDFYPKFYFEQKKQEVFLCNIIKFYTAKKYLFLKKFKTNIWEDFVSNYIYKNALELKPNIIFFYNLDYINKFTLLNLKSKLPNTKFICWHGDDLLNPRFNIESQLLKIPLIDVHFTPRSHLISDYKTNKAKEVISVNWYPKDVRKSPLDKLFDLNFFGSIDKKREKYLSNLKFTNFIIGGYGWNHKNINADKIYNHVPLNIMNEIIASSKISLNFLTESNRDRTNFRNFEIPSQFSLQICERSEEICEIFKENIGVVCFESEEELKEKISFYLRNDSISNKIIATSHKIISDYKYSQDFQLNIVQNRINLFD